MATDLTTDRLNNKTPQNGNGVQAFPIGVGGGLLLTIGFALARAVGLTSLNIEMGLGGIITRTIGTGTWVLGLLFHLLLAGAIAGLYAKAFKFIGRVNWKIGIGLGFIHWLAIGLFMGALPILHDTFELFPRAHTLSAPEITSPGYFGLNLGAASVIILLTLHLLYAGYVGFAYSRSLKKKQTLLSSREKKQSIGSAA